VVVTGVANHLVAPPPCDGPYCHGTECHYILCRDLECPAGSVPGIGDRCGVQMPGSSGAC
jgi:hypothetical protein